MPALHGIAGEPRHDDRSFLEAKLDQLLVYFFGKDLRIPTAAAQPLAVNLEKPAIAALLIQSGLDGNHQKPEQLPRTPRAYFYYRLHRYLTPLRVFAIGLLLSVTFLEHPRWCRHELPGKWTRSPPPPPPGPWTWIPLNVRPPPPPPGPSPWWDYLTLAYWEGALVAGCNETVNMNGHLFLSLFGAGVLEMFVVVLLLFDTWIQTRSRNDERHWSQVEIYRMYVLLVLVLDRTFLHMTFLNSWMMSIAPYLRVALLILYWPAITKSFMRCLVHTTRGLANMVAVGLVFLFAAAWLGVMLFEDMPAGQDAYGTFGRGLFTTCELLTASNYPEVKQGLFRASRWTYVYFLGFFFMGSVLLMNMLLASVYSIYQDRLKEDFIAQQLERKARIRQAYRLMCGRDGRIDFLELRVVLEFLVRFRTWSFRSEGAERVRLIFRALDSDRSGCLSPEEFASIPELLQYRILSEPKPLPDADKRLAGIVTQPKFETLVDIVLVLNLGVLMCESYVDLMDKDSEGSAWGIGMLEMVFSAMYMAEMSAKIQVYGAGAYFSRPWSAFDGYVTMSLAVGVAAVMVSGAPELLRYFVFARLLRLVRLAKHIPSFRRTVASIATLVPTTGPPCLLLFLLVHVFAFTGTELFGGYVNNYNEPLLEMRSFWPEGAYGLSNFNDVSSGMVALGDFLLAGYDGELVAGMALATSPLRAYPFFIAFYFFGTVVMFNVLTAFVIDAFLVTSRPIKEATRQGERDEGDWLPQAGISGEVTRGNAVTSKMAALAKDSGLELQRVYEHTREAVLHQMFRDDIEERLEREQAAGAPA